MNQIDKRKQHLKRAAEMLEKKKREEEAKDQAYYEKITTGNQLKFLKVAAFFCILVNILVCADLFVDGESEALPVGSYSFDRPLYAESSTAIWVGQDVYLAYYKDFVSVDYDSFKIVRSILSNQPRYISYIGHTLDKPLPFRAYPYISIYRAFPYLQIALLIPFFVLILRRKSAVFNFMRSFALYIVFPISIAVLIFSFT